MGYLLEKVINNLSVWSSESELSNDTVDLLVTLVEKRERWGDAFRSSLCWHLMTFDLRKKKNQNRKNSAKLF